MVMQSLRVLLVNDSPVFLESAKRFFSLDDRIEVIGLALSSQEALEGVAQLHPDLVLLDITMPDMNGFKATALIKAELPPPLVNLMALNDGPAYHDAAREAFADGFVDKSELGRQLVPLIETLFPELANYTI